MHQNISFDRELVARYDGIGPRYTSYPTAIQFTEEFTEANYRAAATSSNGDPIPRPLSLYLHIPFCTSPCFYCACTKVITRDKKKGGEYLQRLYREAETQGSLFDRDRTVKQLHLGGGTPTFLTPDEILELLSVLDRCFRLEHDDSREFSIEIDPRTLDVEGLDRLVGAGFNRVSLGIQDFDPAVQRAVNRVQSEDQTFALLDAARASGVRSVSVDLIYGLPHQTPDSFSDTLDTVIAAGPDRLALYSYAHLPHLFKPQKRIKSEDVPPPEVKLALMQRSIEKLTQAGYVYIGMDHFSRPDDELAVAQREGTLQRNFQGYSTRSECDLIGLGMSSIGGIGDCYAQNVKDLVGYCQAIDGGGLAVRRGMKLTADDRLRREIIQSIMCHGRLDFTETGERWHITFHQYFSEALRRLEPLAADGLIELTDDHLEVTPVGRLLIRPVAMCFDAYLDQGGGEQRFSRVI